MTDTCEECGRPLPVPIGAPVGNTVSPCFRLFYADDEDWAVDALIECKTVAIQNLRARVQQLEASLENYDTTDAQNHAVEQVVQKLNRILDERHQVGTFGSAATPRQPNPRPAIVRTTFGGSFLMFSVRIDKDGDGYVFRVQPTEGSLEMVAMDSAPGVIAFVNAYNAGHAARRAWDMALRMGEKQPGQINPAVDAFIRELQEKKPE